GGGALPCPHLIPLAAGLAASDAVFETSGVECGLKWPNDIVHGGRKLGGILSEGVSGGPGGDFAVVGIGLNVGHGPDDFPADIRAASTSIRLAGGRAVTVDALWTALCGALDGWYNVLTRGDKEKVIRTFESRPAFPRGSAVRVETAEGIFDAEYLGLDAEGRLVVARAGARTAALAAVLKLERIS
ncbi:MAG: biotin--[acetyl-CoA-carboxylase] ligase, partial [Candidatus Aminicenantales bacterium]